MSEILDLLHVGRDFLDFNLHVFITSCFLNNNLFALAILKNM